MVSTPEKLGDFISDENIHENNQYASYLCKAYYDYIQELKRYYGFSYAEILEGINSKLELKANNEIKYEAFRSSLRRIEKKRSGSKNQLDKQVGKNLRAHKYNNGDMLSDKIKAVDEKLSPEWIELLKDHPLIDEKIINKAISNGLTFDKANEANKEGIIRFAEIVNKYLLRELK